MCDVGDEKGGVMKDEGCDVGGGGGGVVGLTFLVVQEGRSFRSSLL